MCFPSCQLFSLFILLFNALHHFIVTWSWMLFFFAFIHHLLNKGFPFFRLISFDGRLFGPLVFGIVIDPWARHLAMNSIVVFQIIAPFELSLWYFEVGMLGAVEIFLFHLISRNAVFGGVSGYVVHFAYWHHG